MGIFGRKKTTEDKKTERTEGKTPFSAKTSEGQDKDTEDSGNRKSIRVKNIKDLNAQNKRKRKEPIRAWNKFDRLVLLFVILFTFGLSCYLALSSSGFKLPNLPRLSIPRYNLFGEKIIVLDSSGVDKNITTGIIESFNSKTKSLSGIYGLYVVDLGNDFSFGVYENENFQAASLIKLPVMVGMYIADKEGVLDLDTIYKLKATDKVKGSGSLYNKPVGYGVSYRDLIKLMGKESDNTAFNICRKTLGDEKIEEIISEIGMKDTSLKTNETTPYDIGLFFKNLWDGKIIDGTDTDELLSFLTDTIYEKHLAAGVPDGIRVAHKYGREIKTLNDAGIIYTDHPFVLVILGKDVDLEEGDTVFPELSNLIYGKLEEIKR